MLNLYSCTNLDRWTKGTANRNLKHEDRNPHYFEFAESEAQAIKQAKSHLNMPEAFDAVLIKKNVAPPFQSAKATAGGNA